MIRVPLGSTGLLVSRMAFGASLLGSTEASRRAATRRLDAMIDRGLNFIHTSPRCRDSEQFVGRATSRNRQDFVIAVKYDLDSYRSDRESQRRSFSEADIDRSLTRLGTDRIDLVLLQANSCATLTSSDALDPLERMRGKGKVRYIGFSGDNDAAASAAELPLISVIEMSISIVDQHNLWHVLPAARRRRLGIIAKRPFSSALWRASDRMTRGVKQNEYHARWKHIVPRLEQFGLTMHARDDWGRFALQFCLSQTGVHSVVVNNQMLAKLLPHAQSLVQVQLNPATIAAVTSAFEGAEYASGQKWLSQT